MRTEELIVYRNFEEEQLLLDMERVMACAGRKEQEFPAAGAGKGADFDEIRALFYRCLYQLLDLAGHYGFHGNLWHCYLANLLVNNENSYSRSCECRGAVSGTINAAALHDIGIFKEFFDYDLERAAALLEVPEVSLVLHYESSSQESRVYNKRICQRICELAEALRLDGARQAGADCDVDGVCQAGADCDEDGACQAGADCDVDGVCQQRADCGLDGAPQRMKDTLTQFYREYGVGRFGLHKSFRVCHDQEGVHIVPILNIAHVKLDDLVGYEIPKKKLVDNTEAFVRGKKANNCLLYGDAGTGKSSCIKAIANEYYTRGLRVIEIYRHQFQDLNEVIAQIKNRNYKFIIYMDDLSFEDFETEYKYLKAVIEGGLERKPENVLIYATSNRRHLIRENYSDKEEIREDMHTSDTVQEKLSLAARFGVTIYFGSPDPRQFRNIVITLARRNGLQMPEEQLLAGARQWELNHGGLSGRTAQQFIDYLLGL